MFVEKVDQMSYEMCLGKVEQRVEYEDARFAQLQKLVRVQFVDLVAEKEIEKKGEINIFIVYFKEKSQKYG